MSDLLSNRRTRVLLELGNRADLSTIVGGLPSRIDRWLSDSYTEIGMGYDFAELELTIDGQVVQGQDSLAYPADARAVQSLNFYRLDGSATSVQPFFKNIQYIRQFNPVNQGPPSNLAYFALTVIMRPVPDQTYNYTLDYWQKPQISNVAGDLGATVINVPDDWLEIVDYGAMMRGHAELQEAEKAQVLQNLLYGITLPTGKAVPGLIAARMTRKQAQSPSMDYGIQPSQAKLSYGSVRG